MYSPTAPSPIFLSHAQPHFHSSQSAHFFLPQTEAPVPPSLKGSRRLSSPSRSSTTSPRLPGSPRMSTPALTRSPSSSSSCSSVSTSAASTYLRDSRPSMDSIHEEEAPRKVNVAKLPWIPATEVVTVKVGYESEAEESQDEIVEGIRIVGSAAGVERPAPKARTPLKRPGLPRRDTPIPPADTPSSVESIKTSPSRQFTSSLTALPAVSPIYTPPFLSRRASSRSSSSRSVSTASSSSSSSSSAPLPSPKLAIPVEAKKPIKHRRDTPHPAFESKSTSNESMPASASPFEKAFAREYLKKEQQEQEHRVMKRLSGELFNLGITSIDEEETGVKRWNSVLDGKVWVSV